MKAIVKRNEFSGVLGDIARLVSTEKRGGYDDVLIRSVGGGVEVMSTDGSVFAATRIPARGGEDGVACVSLRALRDLVRGAKGAECELERGAARPRLIFRAGNGESGLIAMGEGIMPPLPEVGGTVVLFGRAELAKALGAVVYAADKPEPARRQVGAKSVSALLGVLFEFGEGGATLVATNSYRLSAYDVGVADVRGGARDVIVPARVLDAAWPIWATMTGEQYVEMTIGETAAKFRVGELVVISPLIQVQFPDWHAAVPHACETRFTIGKKDMETALAAALASGPRKHEAVTLDIRAGELVVSAKNDRVEGRSSVPISLEGKPAVVRVNPAYVVDAVSGMTDEAFTFEYGERRPIVMRSAGGKHLQMVMPIVLG